jgi:hypothetical protein
MLELWKRMLNNEDMIPFYYIHHVNFKNKIWKVYSLENTDIPKVFCMSHCLGHCCTNVMWGHWCALDHSCTDVIKGHWWALGHSCAVICSTCATMHSNNDLPSHCCGITHSNNGLWSHCCTTMGTKDSHCCATMTPVMQLAYPQRKNVTDRHAWVRKVFFVHAREWRTPENTIQETFLLPHIYFCCKTDWVIIFCCRNIQTYEYYNLKLLTEPVNPIVFEHTLPILVTFLKTEGPKSEFKL